MHSDFFFLLIKMEYLLYILFYSRIILHRRDIYPLINSFSISTLLLLSQYQLLKTTLIALQMRMVFFFNQSDLFPVKGKTEMFGKAICFQIIRKQLCYCFCKDQQPQDVIKCISEYM